MTLEKQEQLSQKLVETGKYLLANQLAWGTSGNISARLNDKQMLITASGTEMGSLQPNDFAFVNFETGDWEGDRKPSKEVPMHTGIYQVRQDANVILHSSPFYTTLMASSEEPIVSELFVETMYFLEDVAYVDYFHPGTAELGEAVKEQAENGHVLILRNHGVILFDDSFSDAVMRLETLEMACRMIITAKSAGIPLTKIPDQVVRDFLENARYKPRKRIWQK
ncbi:class II aldolase/adducin family protein [Pullulanibacillus sp. KACC 23026]|uniref:class II aldolase/adducin family protein n=1 Tax=Pullulanibacillus sp. KACC 23026 TaxID=3028315 RepID=UPI0023B13458|nr:class II aldolase/adducin family protein [Pullulanibacillus sp. KACC 23026]WEG13536.1 class II aldolase/adducin family protein [Pullulanibacillus sp. KACC 23026]